MRYLSLTVTLTIKVATVLTACGIETFLKRFAPSGFMKGLQQYLPLAVLKLANHTTHLLKLAFQLQQYLPLAVLKPLVKSLDLTNNCVATVLTACGIETCCRQRID